VSDYFANLFMEEYALKC